MPITPLPTPPTRQDPDNFAQRGDEFLAALPAFALQANALADQVNEDEENVASMAAAVLPASAAALAAANYVGVWSSLSGSRGIPTSVFHAGRFWILLNAVGNVATSQPGVSTDWAPVTDDIGLIGHFPFSAAPTGWLKANGAAVSRTAYAALYARAVATGSFAVDAADWADNPGKFYVGNGTTTFNLPDLRGDHLRSLDDGKGVDPARGLSTLQQSQNASHSHTGTTGAQSADHTHAGTTAAGGAHEHPANAINGLTGGSYGMNFRHPGAGFTHPNGSSSFSAPIDAAGSHTHTFSTAGMSNSHTHSFTTAASGGTEARVRNTALLACIKY